MRRFNFLVVGKVSDCNFSAVHTRVSDVSVSVCWFDNKLHRKHFCYSTVWYSLQRNGRNDRAKYWNVAHTFSFLAFLISCIEQKCTCQRRGSLSLPRIRFFGVSNGWKISNAPVRFQFEIGLDSR